jgi:signal transduction histidine kinase
MTINHDFHLIKKLLDAQPIISFATLGDYKLISWNLSFENFFEITKQQEIDIRDIVPNINDKWINEMLLTPHQSKRISLSKGLNSYIFNVYFNITYLESNYLYIYTFVDVTEFEEMREREYLQATMVSIGELSLGLTHEVNTPLTYIRGSADLMEMDIDLINNIELKKLFSENLTAIQNGVERIQTIIDLLQEYGSNCHEISQTLDLKDIVFDVFLFLSYQSKYIANIYFNKDLIDLNFKRIHCLDDSFNIKFPRAQLIKIFVVIIQNSLEQLAISNLPFSERKIEIFASLQNSVLNIRIEDNGGGIPEHILKNMFKPFISGKTQSGMGLGLNIVKKMVEANSGRIFAKNSSTGAIFNIFISAK